MAECPPKYMISSIFFLMAALSNASPPLAPKTAPLQAIQSALQMGAQNTSIDIELPGGGIITLPAIVSQNVSLPTPTPTPNISLPTWAPTHWAPSAPLHFKPHRPQTQFRERHQNKTERHHDLSGIVDKFPNVTKDTYETQRLVALTLVEQALELLRLALSTKP